MITLTQGTQQPIQVLNALQRGAFSWLMPRLMGYPSVTSVGKDP